MRLGPRPLSSRVDSSSRVASSSHVASPSRVASSSPVASSSRVACPSRVASRVVVVPCCQWVVVLGVCGFSWCRAPVAIHGWWCGHVVVSWSGGEASSSSSMGCRSPFPSAYASAGLVCYPTVVLGLQTRLVRWRVMTTGSRSPSSAPSHVRGMGAPPVRCCACTCICCIEGRADGGRR